MVIYVMYEMFGPLIDVIYLLLTDCWERINKADNRNEQCCDYGHLLHYLLHFGRRQNTILILVNELYQLAHLFSGLTLAH